MKTYVKTSFVRVGTDQFSMPEINSDIHPIEYLEDNFFGEAVVVNGSVLCGVELPVLNEDKIVVKKIDFESNALHDSLETFMRMKGFKESWMNFINELIQKQ